MYIDTLLSKELKGWGKKHWKQEWKSMNSQIGALLNLPLLHVVVVMLFKRKYFLTLEPTSRSPIAGSTDCPQRARRQVSLAVIRRHLQKN